MTNPNRLLDWGVERLPASSTPRLDAEVLLACALGCSRTQIYVLPTVPLLTDWRYRWLIGRRRAGVPVAYLTGHKEFFGLDFLVDQRVLIPRPETETIVRRAIQLAREHHITTIYDVGTGSGNIAVSLAKHLPEVKIIASDKFAHALAVARLNARRHQVSSRVQFVQAELGQHVVGESELVVANLPYVPNNYQAQKEIFYEPSAAVFVAGDGLDLYREFLLTTRFRIGLIELGPWQMDRLTSWLRTHFPHWTVEPITDESGYACGLQLMVGPSADAPTAQPRSPLAAASRHN